MEGVEFFAEAMHLLADTPASSAIEPQRTQGGTAPADEKRSRLQALGLGRQRFHAYLLARRKPALPRITLKPAGLRTKRCSPAFKGG